MNEDKKERVFNVIHWRAVAVTKVYLDESDLDEKSEVEKDEFVEQTAINRDDWKNIENGDYYSDEYYEIIEE